MKTLLQQVTALNALIAQFKFQEALDEFYSEEIITCENENQPTVGLVNYKAAATRYLDSISKNTATLKNVIVSDDISASEWHYIFDHREWGHWDRVQLSVQRWKNGKIIHERHYYRT